MCFPTDKNFELDVPFKTIAFFPSPPDYLAFIFGPYLGNFVVAYNMSGSLVREASTRSGADSHSDFVGARHTLHLRHEVQPLVQLSLLRRPRRSGPAPRDGSGPARKNGWADRGFLPVRGRVWDSSRRMRPGPLHHGPSHGLKEEKGNY